MTAATGVVAPVEVRRPKLEWGFLTYVWLLPFHALVVAVLFGALGWPEGLVRALAAWKEALLAVLLGVALLRTARHPGSARGVHWLDLAVIALAVVSLGYLLGARLWFGAEQPLAAQLYGARDAGLLSLLYFVGRASPEVAQSPGVLRALFLVGVLTSAIAVLERIFVSPEMLVLLGAARYVQDFLGATIVASGNIYGLTDNYWTNFGGELVRRAGSTYLSGQGFAVPFLVLMPAATLWTLTAPGRGASMRWLGYGLVWTGLLLSVTRMTIVACALATLLIVAAHRRWAPLLTLGVAGLLGVAAALFLVPGFGTYVWETITWQSGSSVWHVKDWTAGLDHFLRHPLGAGLGSTDFVAARFGVLALTGDNQYLKYAVELGVLGVFLHAALLAGALWSGIRGWRTGVGAHTRTGGLLLATMTIAIVLNAVTAVVFNSPMVAYPFYWLLGSVTTAAWRHEETVA